LSPLPPPIVPTPKGRARHSCTLQALWRLGPRGSAWVRRSGMVALLLLPSCHTRPASGFSEVVIDFWGMGREGEVAQQLMPEFEREHPGVRVHVQQIPWTAAHEKLLTAYVGHASPDVAQLGNTWVPEFVALDALVPLDSALRTTPSVAASDYFPGIW